MRSNTPADASKSTKVLFVRLDEDIYKQVAALADTEERSINWMATKLLKVALQQHK